MKIVRVETLTVVGVFASSDEWERDSQVAPSRDPRSRLAPRERPIPYLSREWQAASNGERSKADQERAHAAPPNRRVEVEQPLNIATACTPGKLDAVLYSPGGLVALEWETGNISSSHRALNKMALGLLKGILVCGVLVVPSRALYPYLTDRIGNISELMPYVDLWKAIPCSEAVLEIVVVEHDGTSTAVPRIPKGTSGRAEE